MARSKKEKAKLKKYKSTQIFSPIRDIRDGIIITKDGRFVKLLEFTPVNLAHRSQSDREAIATFFAAAIRAMPDKVQIKIVERKSDGDSLALPLADRYDLETNANVRDVIEDEIVLIESVATVGVSRRFFLCFEYEEQSGLFSSTPDEEQIKMELDRTARTIAAALKDCGNICISPAEDSDYTLAALYYIFCSRQSSEVSYEYKKNSVLLSYLNTLNMEMGGGILPINDIICPKLIDARNKNSIVIDGVHYIFCYLPGRAYPKNTISGWMANLVNLGEGIDIDLFIQKAKDEKTQRELSRGIEWQKSKLNSTSTSSADFYKVREKAEAGLYLQSGLAAGDDFIFISTLITISADTEEEAEYKFKSLEMHLIKGSIELIRCRYEQKEALLSTLPLCSLDKSLFSKTKRNILTSDLGSAYPFVSSEHNDNGGVFLGISKDSESFIFLDNFDSKKYPNGNMIITGTSGAGKTYTLMCIALRWRALGVPVYIVSAIKGHEYQRSTSLIGGTYIQLGGGRKTNINIMDINPYTSSANVALGMDKNYSLMQNKAQTIHTFFSMILSNITEKETSVLDESIIKTYEKFGITEDNDTLINPDGSIKKMPTLKDLHEELSKEKSAERIVSALNRFVVGSAKSFSYPTNVDLNNDYTVIDVSSLSEELRPIGMFVANTYLFEKIKEDITKRKVLILDELWTLIGQGTSAKAAEFVKEQFKTIRGLGGIAIGATQDMNDFFSCEDGKYGKGILNNAKIRFIMMPEYDELEMLTKTFSLSNTEQQKLSTASPHEGLGLLLTGTTRAFVNVIASQTMHEYITTDREELEELAKKEGKNH